MRTLGATLTGCECGRLRQQPTGVLKMVLNEPMLQLTLPELEDSGKDDESRDDCLCETTDLGCFEHFSVDK